MMTSATGLSKIKTRLSTNNNHLTSVSRSCLAAPPSGIKRAAGLTLLELLVVIMIVGLLTNFVVLSYPDSSPAETAEKETRKFAHLVSLASQDSLLRSRAIAIHFNEKGYRFLVRNEENLWIELKDKLFKPRSLPGKVSLELNINSDDSQFAPPTQDNPQVVVSASGEITPFKVRMIVAGSSTYSELTANFNGQLKIKNVEEPQ